MTFQSHLFSSQGIKYTHSGNELAADTIQLVTLKIQIEDGHGRGRAITASTGRQMETEMKIDRMTELRDWS